MAKLLLVLTEVDDLVYTGDQELVDIFEAKLKKKWNIQQSEPLRSFLGININYDREQGTIEFDVAEKIRKLFEEKPWLNNIGYSSLRRRRGRVLSSKT